MVAFVVLASIFSATGEQVVTGITDSTITARVQTLYLLNEHLNPMNINTTTHDGNVMISGSVDDMVQKDLAEDLAMSVPGVGFVDNRLVVINTVVGEKEQRTWKERVADRAVSASVKARLLMNGEFKGLRLGISTVNGIVTLYGVVPTEEHAIAMAKVTEETKGVVEVINEMTVRPKDDSYDLVRGAGRQIADEWLESRIATAILLNRHLGIGELDVEVDDGICFLSGSVNSEEKKELAGSIADSIQGVNEVRNNIAVREGETVELLPPTESTPVESAPSGTDLRGSEPPEDNFFSGSAPEIEEKTLAAP